MTRSRLIAALLCLFLLLPLAPTPARAEGESTLAVGTVGGARGDTVTLEVVLDAVNGIAGGSFTVVYDSAALVLLDAVPGIAGGTVNKHSAENAVRISFAGTSPLQTPGCLLSLTFRISDAAPLDLLPVTLDKVRFYDVEASEVAVQTADGGVNALAAGLELSSDRCLPGQAVKLEVTLAGGLHPAGGEFYIRYNPRLLAAGSVKAEQKLGNVQINLSYSIDEERHLLHVSWAAGEAIDALGRLCTVIFAVDESAAGDTEVRIEGQKFYSESGARMDALPPVNGIITVVDHWKEQPMIYVVGGKRSDDGTAVVQVAVDGAGEVCGGQFSLTFDPEKCELQTMTPKMGCVATNPSDVASVSGSIQVSWAEDSPALDNETVLELTFRMKTEAAAELSISDAVLKDKLGATISGIVANGGMIGLSSCLQPPVAEIVNTESSAEIRATLFDAQFCGNAKTSAATFILAFYSGEQFRTVTVPKESISFDHNGIAHLSVDAATDSGADRLQLFILDASGTMSPMCDKVCVDLTP